ncbi:hypothetical protein [Gordonibacter sp. 28C]|nr:hypothetical protein [Gordonibacter sp. 28C]
MSLMDSGSDISLCASAKASADVPESVILTSANSSKASSGVLI